MKIVTQRALLAQGVKTVSGALVKGNTPADPSQYIMVKADEKELSLVVAGDSLTAKVTLEAERLDGGLLSISSGGKHAVNGSMLLHDLTASPVNGDITLEFKEQKSSKPKKQAEADELGEDADKTAVEPDTIGTLFLKYPGPKDQIDTTKLPVVDVQVDPKIDEEMSARITMRASEFVSYVRQVGIATGKASMNEDYSNVLIKTNGNIVEMVGTNGQQLSLCRFESLASTKDVSAILPYEKVAAIAKMIQTDDNSTVTLYLTTGTTRDAVFRQDVTYGGEGKVVGKAVFKIRERTDRFVQYESLIKNLSFVNSCKVKRQQLKAVCDRLDVVELAKTAVSFDPSNGLITFVKDGPSGGSTIHLPMSDATGQKLDLNVSNRHFKVAVDATAEEEIELKLSGAKSLGLMVLSPNFSMYFMPFNLAD